MDGGVKQAEMAEILKRQVKDNRRAAQISRDRIPGAKPIWDLEIPMLQPTSDTSKTNSERCTYERNGESLRGDDCTLSSNPHGGIAFGRSDTVLLTFYLEHLLPFLFPFYQPPLLEGGRAWILELMISSHVVRGATLCLSSYFFSLLRGTANPDLWETVLTQTRDAFGLLRQALQIIEKSSIAEHLPGAVRIMASIIQVQRFEIAELSFDNCQTHLNASLALFEQILDSADDLDSADSMSSFNTVISQLGPSSWILPAQCVQVPSAEQAAFRFSSALLIFDDIIASTVLQDPPRLYWHHRSLLGSINGSEPPINLEAVVGCHNWAVLQIGEIAVLNAWKQRCKIAGTLDVIELARRGTAIKEVLNAYVQMLENNPMNDPKEVSSLVDVFTENYPQRQHSSASQSSLITRVWAHGAILYLSMVVFGWQPASMEVRYHISQVVELLLHQIKPTALLRTMIWPFCIAGCLANPMQETLLRGMAESLQPPSVFGTVHKALEIMENVWQNREARDFAKSDFASCFKNQDKLVLLV